MAPPSSSSGSPQASMFTQPAASSSSTATALHPGTPLGLGMWMTIGAAVALIALRHSLPN